MSAAGAKLNVCSWRNANHLSFAIPAAPRRCCTSACSMPRECCAI